MMSNLPFCYDENITIFDPAANTNNPQQHHSSVQQHSLPLPLPPPPVIPRFDPFPTTATNNNSGAGTNTTRFEPPPLLRFDLPITTSAPQSHRFEIAPVGNTRFDPPTSRFDPSNATSIPITIPRWEPHTAIVPTLEDPVSLSHPGVSISTTRNTNTMTSSSTYPSGIAMVSNRTTAPASSMNAILDTICDMPNDKHNSNSSNMSPSGGITRKSGNRKPRRQRKRPPGWTPMPRDQRVYKECTTCHWKNHVRRLCCEKCFTSKSDMKKNSSSSSSKARNNSNITRNISNNISSNGNHSMPSSLLSSPELPNHDRSNYHHNGNGNGYNAPHHL